MQRFWDIVTRPLLEAVQPASIIEVGSADGGHTRRLLEFCRRADWSCTLHSIDPLPRYSVEELVAEHPQHFHPICSTSLEALPKLAPADVVLLDGDHNWYTVYHELRQIEQTARAGAAPFPVLVCHDVGWPYARRDLYYDPAAVPDVYRQPYLKGGLLPGVSEPQPGKGLNAHLYNAAHEGGSRNGVRTAIEDFIHQSREPLQLVVVPVLYGLAIVIPDHRLTGNTKLRDLLARLSSADGQRQLAELAERYRLAGDMAAQTLRARLAKLEQGAAAPLSPASTGDGFSSGLPSAVLASIQKGVLSTQYKGMRFWKSPFDVVIYTQLIERLRPQTIIETGTLDGGSAVWFADQMEGHGLAPQVISIDKRSRPKNRDSRIVFLEADAKDLDVELASFDWKELPRPWLVVEDSAHTYDVTAAVLRFFDARLVSGDYMVVEDGIVRDMPDEIYRRYEDGPNRAVSEFMKARASAYEIDRGLCDLFGPNFTWNPSGYIRRR